MSESDTPRVNAVGTNGGYYRSQELGWYVPIAFARELERENNRLKRQLEEAITALMTIDARSQYPNIAGVSLDRIKQLLEDKI